MIFFIHVLNPPELKSVKVVSEATWELQATAPSGWFIKSSKITFQKGRQANMLEL